MQKLFCKKRMILYVAIAGCLATAFPVFGRENIRVGFFQFDGYHETDASLKRGGYGYDLLQMLRGYTDWNFEYIGYMAGWAQMLPMLENGEIDIVSSVAITPERRLSFDFTARPVGQSSTIMTVKAGQNKYFEEDYANWNGIRVGMLRGNSKNSLFADFAKRKNFTFQEFDYDTVLQLAEALQTGSVDAIVSGSLRKTKNEWVYEQLDTQPFYFAVKKGRTQVLAELDSAIEALYAANPNFIDELQRKHYSGIEQRSGVILLNQREREFLSEIQKHDKPIRVLVNPDRYPLSYFDREGNFSGVMSEVLSLIEQRSGLRFEPVRCANRAEYSGAVQKRLAPVVVDMVADDLNKAERIGYLLTGTYFPASVSRLSRKAFFGFPRTAAVVRASNMAAAAWRGLAGTSIKFVEYDSVAEVIEAVKQKRQDVAFLFTRTAESAILSERGGTLSLDPAGLSVPFAIGVDENADPRLYSILYRAAATISSEEVQQMLLAANMRLHREPELRELISENPLWVSLTLLGFIVVLSGTSIVFLVSRRRVKKAAASLRKHSRMWKILIDSLPIHIFAKDANDHFRYVFSNKTRADFYGQRFKQIEGLTDYDLFPREFADARFHEDSITANTPDEVREQTFDLIDKDDQTHHVRSIQREFHDPDGTRLLLSCTVDLTEQINARRTAEENAELFHKTLISIGDGVMTTDGNGAITLLNPVAEKMLAKKLDDVRGRSHSEVFNIVSYLDGTKVASPVEKALSTGEVVALANHTDLIAADGTRYHIADSAAPIRGVDGKIQGAILVFRDVTHEYDLRDRLTESAAQLRHALSLAQSASSAKGVFLSQMSHEIRTPLNAIIGYLTIARDNAGSLEKVNECLDKGMTASKHLLSIINDILDISSIESGKMKIADEEFDFKHLMTGIVAMFYNQAEAKGIRFDVSLDEVAEEWLIGDSLRVNQILMNLLSNALKFTPAGGAITLKVKQMGFVQRRIQMLFEVTDTGCGMSKEFLSRLFQPFEQQDSSTARKFGGNGLGMSITKNLVSMMGGTIEVKSEENKGTTFSILIPFGKSSRRITSEGGDFSKLRALITDDNETDCDYLSQVLKRCGVKSDTVQSGEAALTRFANRLESRHPYDLCLIDLRLGGMDGLETARQIRKINKGANLPIILVTAYDVSAVAESAHSAGVDKVIAKPLFQSTFFDFLMSTYYEQEKAQVGKHDTEALCGLRVMLVEDNQMNMDIATQFLTKAGLIVTPAWNGLEAVEKFSSSGPDDFDAILMDIQMPIMDGYEATRKIRESSHPRAKTIPIVAMTANAFTEDVTRALQAGMNDHISKPIVYEQLFTSLSNLTAKKDISL